VLRRVGLDPSTASAPRVATLADVTGLVIYYTVASLFLTVSAATARELVAFSARNGVERIDSIGEKLDPNRHQAMMEIPTKDAEPGTIVEEMQPGYVLKDRLLRPALVGVAKKPD
jgi:molecular chaperone GrpE